MKLRLKFFIIFFLISAIPIVLITSVVYRRYYTTTYQQMDEFSSNLFEKAVQQTDDTLDDIVKAANMFTFYSSGSNSLIQNLRPYADPNVSTTPLSIYQTKQNIKYICQNILNSYDFIYGLYVFTPAGVTIDYENTKDIKLHYQYDPTDEAWYQEANRLGGSLYVSDVAVHQSMFSGATPTVFVAKYLYDVYSHKCLGVLLVNCDPVVFDLANINTMPDITTITIENTDTGGIIYSSAGTAAGRAENSKPHQKEVLSSALSLPALKLTAVTNYSMLYKEFNYTGLLLIAISATSLVIALILSWVLSHYLTQPIVELSRIMSEQQGSDLEACERYPARSDEIGILYNEYNNMVEKLNTSIKMDYQNKLIALDSQMKSLEARINSHFLFNTLASFNSIAEIDGSDRLSTMSIALGNMFRYTIKTKSELVTIQDELNHVNDYVSIQKIRFDNKFDLIVTIPEAMKGLTVLKLILQPLVENAITHGLKHCQTGSRITIDGYTKDSLIFIRVSDDGQGIEPGQLEELQKLLQEEAAFTELGHRNNQSIGLKNINTRIELYYGKGYGLTIESEPGMGTSILIKIPDISSAAPDKTGTL